LSGGFFRFQILREDDLSPQGFIHLPEFPQSPIAFVFLESLSMPAVLIFDERDPLPFDGPGNQNNRFIPDPESGFVGPENFRNGMTVENDGFPSKRETLFS
jgi:hypothetical protein